jgi:hypothetical protein
MSFVKMESSKLIIYSTNICRSGQGTMESFALGKGRARDIESIWEEKNQPQSLNEIP